MKLWVAEKSFIGEDFKFIGIFSSKEKAVNACQDFENKDGFVALEFKPLRAADLAHGDTHTFMVWEIEVDKPLESED